MSNVIFTGQPPRQATEEDVNYYYHSLKIGDGAYYLGVGNVGFAIGYRYWRFNVLMTRNEVSPDFVEVMNVYFYQNSVTQSTVGVVASGGLIGFTAQNLLVDDNSIWMDNFDGMMPVYAEFDFGRQVTFDEVKWKTSSNTDTGRDPIMVSIEGTNDSTGRWNMHRFNSYPEGVTEDRSTVVGDLFLDENVFFNIIPPPTGGYTIYEYKERGGPSVVTVNGDSELLTWMTANLESSIETVEDGLDSIINSTSTWGRPIACLNLVHEKITSRECRVAVDSHFVMSYPGTGTVWYNLVDTRDESFLLLNMSLKPTDKTFVYPELETSPGGNSFRFLGSDQSATFEMNDATSDPITVELWCKFTDDFKEGFVFGFYDYGVQVVGGALGFTTTNFDTLSGYHDLYGMEASGMGLTGSYVHLVFVMSGLGTYLYNQIYVNGTEVQLSQIYGTETPSLVNFNRGSGRLAWTTNTRGGIQSLNFSCQVFRIYDTQLTEDEIALNYAAFQSRFS